jgi:hypothetical protein
MNAKVNHNSGLVLAERRTVRTTTPRRERIAIHEDLVADADAAVKRGIDRVERDHSVRIRTALDSNGRAFAAVVTRRRAAHRLYGYHRGRDRRRTTLNARQWPAVRPVRDNANQRRRSNHDQQRGQDPTGKRAAKARGTS